MHDPFAFLESCWLTTDELHLAPLSAVVQLRPQLHHLDAFDEVAIKSKAIAKARKDLDEEAGPRNAPEARAIDVKVKSAEAEQNRGQRNNDLLKRMQDEKWDKYTWVDENVSLSFSISLSRYYSTY